MDEQLQTRFAEILRRELIPSFGCTEPVIIALAAAKARAELGAFPERLALRCSGNIIKNVKSVIVPNSGDRKGIEMAAALGAVGGHEEDELQVLAKITPQEAEKAHRLVTEGFCSYTLAEHVPKLYVAVKAIGGGHSAEVVIAGTHTNIAEIWRDGAVVYSSGVSGEDGEETQADTSFMTVKSILDYAAQGDISPVSALVERQAAYNSAVADEGMNKSYGGNVGRTLLKLYGNDVKIRAKARAASGSDARMSGCELPVVINSGSGNQGITIAMPILEYAKELKASPEQTCRALVLGNLIAIHIKKNIGVLSAFCGAVSAACGAGAGISYLCGGGYEQIAKTITNTLANVSGIVCDGAKPACAAKIASAVDAAITAHYMGCDGHVFLAGDGLVKDNVEETIRAVGRMAANGMVETDREILNIMANG